VKKARQPILQRRLKQRQTKRLQSKESSPSNLILDGVARNRPALAFAKKPLIEVEQVSSSNHTPIEPRTLQFSGSGAESQATEESSPIYAVAAPANKSPGAVVPPMTSQASDTWAKFLLGKLGNHLN
jgi:hypothetical protein